MKLAEPAKCSSATWTENNFRVPEGNNLRQREENNLKEREENNLNRREENNLRERRQNSLATQKADNHAYGGNERVLHRRRAKLFGFDFSSAEWRECGTGEVRLLQHRKTKKARVLMRRGKTLKVCVNHYITSDMRLQPNVGSDRSWVWKVAVDISDGEPVTVALALRFASKQVSDEFKLAFERAQALASTY